VVGSTGPTGASGPQGATGVVGSTALVVYSFAGTLDLSTRANPTIGVTIGFGSTALATGAIVPDGITPITAGVQYWRAPRAGVISALRVTLVLAINPQLDTDLTFTLAVSPSAGDPASGGQVFFVADPIFSSTALSVSLLLRRTPNHYWSGTAVSVAIPIGDGDLVALVLTSADLVNLGVVNVNAGIDFA
jgi:hypothetical protein